MTSITVPSPVANAENALLQFARTIQATNYQFTTATPATHERVNRRPDNEWARNLRDVFGWSRPFHTDLLPPDLFDQMRAGDVAVPHGDGWRSLVRLSSLHGQLFLHSAYPTVDADSVFFGPDTYRFADAIHQHFSSAATGSQKVRRAVDIGCGAGPGAIVTALARPEAEVLAVDINDRALSFARVNAILADTPNVQPRHSDLLTNVEGEFDLIVANPPYLVDPTERAYRHGGGPLGAGLSLAIVEAATERLAPGGILLLYTGAAIVDGGDPFRVAVEERLAAAPGISWTYREVDPDVFGEE
ncbi:MAG: class I SAM-dependent methyltransferase, partial [Armatimonadota bacterium]